MADNEKTVNQLLVQQLEQLLQHAREGKVFDFFGVAFGNPPDCEVSLFCNIRNQFMANVLFEVHLLTKQIEAAELARRFPQGAIQIQQTPTSQTIDLSLPHKLNS